jgi:cytochrome P450
MASPNFSHMLPHVFKEPTKYDPDRFAPPREEDKGKPFSYIGFGGGRHGCIGSNFALLQVRPGHQYLTCLYTTIQSCPSLQTMGQPWGLDHTT